MISPPGVRATTRCREPSGSRTSRNRWRREEAIYPRERGRGTNPSSLLFSLIKKLLRRLLSRGEARRVSLNEISRKRLVRAHGRTVASRGEILIRFADRAQRARNATFRRNGGVNATIKILPPANCYYPSNREHG